MRFLRHSFGTVLLLALWLNGAAQVETPTTKKTTYWFGTHAVNALRPGIQFGLDYGFGKKVREVRKIRTSDTLVILKTRQVLGGVNAAVAWHPKSSTTLITSFTLEYRKTGRYRIQYFIGAGPGIARSFLPNVYEVEGDTPRRKYFAGHTYANLHGYSGFGYFRKKPSTFQFWQVRISMNTLFPYNRALVFMPSAELRFGFWKKPAE